MQVTLSFLDSDQRFWDFTKSVPFLRNIMRAVFRAKCVFFSLTEKLSVAIFCIRSRLHLDGQLLVDNEGLHGMVEKCGAKQISSGQHIVYIEGFQAGGGVGMEMKYSGPDTGGAKIFMRSGTVSSSTDASSQFYKGCNPSTAENVASGLTLCMFRSEVNLDRLPAFGEADTGRNRLYFIGKTSIPSVDVVDVNQFRNFVPLTPDANYAWVIYGQLQIGTAGMYTLCITSDDG